MKKTFLILAVLAVSATAALTSCSEDEEIKKTMCTCIEEDDYGYKEQSKLDPASFGATNCSDLAIKLRMAGGYDSEFYYSCY